MGLPQIGLELIWRRQRVMEAVVMVCRRVVEIVELVAEADFVPYFDTEVEIVFAGMEKLRQCTPVDYFEQVGQAVLDNNSVLFEVVTEGSSKLLIVHKLAVAETAETGRFAVADIVDVTASVVEVDIEVEPDLRAEVGIEPSVVGFLAYSKPFEV